MRAIASRAVMVVVVCLLVFALLQLVVDVLDYTLVGEVPGKTSICFEMPGRPLRDLRLRTHMPDFGEQMGDTISVPCKGKVEICAGMEHTQTYFDAVELRRIYFQPGQPEDYEEFSLLFTSSGKPLALVQKSIFVGSACKFLIVFDVKPRINGTLWILYHETWGRSLVKYLWSKCHRAL